MARPLKLFSSVLCSKLVCKKVRVINDDHKTQVKISIITKEKTKNIKCRFVSNYGT